MRYAVIAHLDPDRYRSWGDAAKAFGLQSAGPIGVAELFLERRSDCRDLGAASRLIGRFFANDGTWPAPPVIDPATLLRSGWGEYVALCTRGAASLQLLRDPSGAVPCYFMTEAGGLLAGSDVKTLETILARRLAIDWVGVEHCLRSGDLRTHRTAIAGLTELLPGQLLTWSPSGHGVETGWTPWSHLDRSAGLPFAAQTEDFASVMLDTVERMSQRRGPILVTTSGGLDSSIVAAALAAAGRDQTCVTLASRDPGGDERRYARLIAQRCGARLFERFLDVAHVDLTLSQAAQLARPTGRPFGQSVDLMTRAVADETGAVVIFHGSGGDNVCGFLQSAAPVADLLLRRRFRSALATARDVAELNRVSIYQALHAGLARSRAGRGHVRWTVDHRFLTPSRETLGLDHPWLTVPETALPGQAARVVLLLRIQNYLETPPGGTGLPAALPYLAQPVVERCLAIPSWQWCEGGRDRAVARAAFTDRLPAEIVARRWKGGPDGFVGAVFEQNRTLLRERLIDGLLAERGLLDRMAISQTLDDRRPPSGADALRLLSLADAESWVRARS